MHKRLMEVVLVEDDEVEIEAVTRALENLHVAYDLTVFRRGRDALHSLHQQRQHLRGGYPFFLLLDLNLPDMSGIELLRRLRQDPALRAALVFVLTVSDGDHDKLAAYTFQAAGYLVKSQLGPRYERLTDLLRAYYWAVEFPER